MSRLKLSKKQVGELGLYELQSYIGAMNQSTFGGKQGRESLFTLLGLNEYPGEKPLEILEVACSTGYNTCEIARRFNCFITGVDISEVIIQKAQERKDENQLNNVKFEVADARKLPYPDNSFDIVFGEAIVALLPDKSEILIEFLRVLRPGGKIATLDLFLKQDAPGDMVNEINSVMSFVIGTKVSVKFLSEWNEIFAFVPIKEKIIQENYESVFDISYSFVDRMKIMKKLMFHLITNKIVRQKIMPAMKLARKMQKITDNSGYLIMVGKK